MTRLNKHSYISRRDFLKLASLLPLAKLQLPDFSADIANSPVDASRPNILFIVFDTLSAAHLPFYGYPRNTAPNLARFAGQSTVYHAHYSSGNFTTPGTASIFTGAYPWSHRAFNLHGTMQDEYASRSFFNLLPQEVTKTVYTHNLLVTTLFRQFQEALDIFKNTRDLCLVDEQYSDWLFPADSNASYWSEGLILRGGATKPSSLFLSMAYKMSRLVFKQRLTQQYGHLFPRGVPNLNDTYFVLEDAIDWMIQELKQLPRPFLGYFHFLPPHEPYTTRRDFIDIFKDNFTPIAKPAHQFTEGHADQFLNRQRREYDEYIAYADAEFGRLMDFLAGHGYFENSYVIITSDHGEMFERGIRGHVTRTLYDPVIRVPLLISKPGQKQRQDVFTPTSAVDFLPTLLHLYGQNVPEWCEGEILPEFGEQEANRERSIFALEAKSSPKLGPITKGTAIIRKGEHKLIYYFGYGKKQSEFEYYDLSRDPEEMQSLYASKKSTAEDLRHELEEKLRRMNQAYLG